MNTMDNHMHARYANPPTSDSQILRRCRQIPAGERAELIRILRQLSDADGRLAGLHLFLPVVEVRFYGLGKDNLQSESLNPQDLLSLLLEGG